MREYLLDNHGVFNAGNDLGGATAMGTAVNILAPPTVTVGVAVGSGRPGGGRRGGPLRPRSATHAAADIVARVNGEDVTSAELQRVKADLLELSRRQGQPGEDPNVEALERLALQTLIHRHLMLQEAGRRKLSVTEDEVDQAITELRRRFADLEDLAAWMGQRGLGDKSLFQTVRGDILTSRVTAALVAKLRVSQQQREEYYALHKDDLIIGEEVRLGIIAVDSEAAADEILTAIGNGEDFNQLARQRSVTTGGDTGWVDPRTLPLPLRQAVGKLKRGEAYGPLKKDDDEYVIVGLAGRRPAQANSFDEAQAEIERRLLAAEKHKAVAAWLAEQESKSKIEVFPRPDNPASGQI